MPVVMTGRRRQRLVVAVTRRLVTVASMLEILHEQHAIGYGGQLVTTEPVRRMNEAYKAFGIKCPGTIGLPVVD